ncbi:hypothetical protein HLH26_05360 [Gluconacetobacter sp. 1b LMG 1731]|uniref:Hedgehog/Intein (Hint) domain-containing protein n=1 Tax=Gluconacetobacter dulcium TaxID=2729096 RepID=A0A7W4IJF4_9PROT|nr:Hint domain-containing protein [Gluconacetobacter dulcium]MBB2163971.1 hypothetical protein [Gluconacetobacter dulcium]MBB2192675.1 hypothetical protein [Gluconacetobacter dulcium]
MATVSSTIPQPPPTITNTATTISGGTWTASLDPSGATVYSSGSTTVSGPVNLWGTAILNVNSGAVVSGLTAVARFGNVGPTINVSAGGTIENSYTANGYLNVYSGGITQNNTYESEVTKIYSGGSSTKDVFTESDMSGWTSGTLNGTAFAGGDGTSSVYVYAGGSIAAPSVVNQSLTVNKGASYESATTPAAPPVITNTATTISGGIWTASRDPSGATVYSSGSTTVAGPVNLWGTAILNVTSGAVVSGLTAVAPYGNVGPTINVSAGGTIENSYTANGYLNVYSGGVTQNNTYESEVTNILSGGSSTNDVFTESYMSGWTSGMLNGTAFAGGDGTASVTVAAGGSISAPTVVNQALTVNKGASYEACFLAGTMIRTPTGDVAVEELSTGDTILAYVDGQPVARTIVWAGMARVHVRPRPAGDEAGWPLRIVKDAFADGVPYKDMLITSEHCLFFDGAFVPARMLVNGQSIFYDRSIPAYAYYHIETEGHAVVMADGVLTESYLDTGNREVFRQHGRIASLAPDRALTWNDAACPLDVSRAFVEPLFRRIAARAAQIGAPTRGSDHVLTDEMDLHLVTGAGAIIRPVRQNGAHVMFMLPADIQEVHIVSRASRPSDVIGPFVDDRRHLGVLIGEITLFEGSHSTEVTAHLSANERHGWSTSGQERLRWTTGNAILPLGARRSERMALLALEVRAGGPYFVPETDADAVARIA